jgi:hypothetical protein
MSESLHQKLAAKEIKEQALKIQNRNNYLEKSEALM